MDPNGLYVVPLGRDTTQVIMGPTFMLSNTGEICVGSGCVEPVAEGKWKKRLDKL